MSGAEYVVFPWSSLVFSAYLTARLAPSCVALVTSVTVLHPPGEAHLKTAHLWSVSFLMPSTEVMLPLDANTTSCPARALWIASLIVVPVPATASPATVPSSR